MSKNTKTRIKIPHTKWSIDVDDVIMFPLMMFGPIVGSLLLASIFGFWIMYLLGFIVLSYILVTGIDFIEEEKND